MKTPIGILVAAALVSAAVTGCTTTDSDARLAAVESELKALRAELAELKAQSARPAPPPGAAGDRQAAALAGFPGTTVDPEMLEKLRILGALPNGGDDRALKDLQGRVEKLGELAKTVEALQGDVVKLKEGSKGR